jgi:hypothetical protein
MASQQSLEGKRVESIEVMVWSLIGAAVLIWVWIYYHHHIWYYFSVYFYQGLDFIPDSVNKVLFFWKAEDVLRVPQIADDLLYHAGDYGKYYWDNDTGIRKKLFMDRLGLFMVAPYIAIPSFFIIFKELRRVRSPIKKPGERGGGNALNRYAKSQSDIWPYIKPVINIMDEMVKNPDLDDGWYALPEMPIAWMRNKGVIKELKKKKRRKLLTVRERSELNLDMDASYLVLRENLGEIWNGVNELDDLHRWLLAVIVPHIFGQIGVSRRLNRKICRFYELNKSKEDKRVEPALKKEIDAEVSRILEKYAKCFERPYFEDSQFDDPYDPIISSFEELDNEKDLWDKGEALVRDVLLRHFYVKTVFFALIERSWTYGVLASAELLWVKTVDRELWYVVSQQGRNSAFVEVCGAWSHYLAEDSYGFRTLMPQLIEGFNAFDFALWSTHDNCNPHNEWENTSKWDKLVPDGVGKGSKFPKAPTGSDPTKMA